MACSLDQSGRWFGVWFGFGLRVWFGFGLWVWFRCGSRTDECGGVELPTPVNRATTPASITRQLKMV